jgi:hypothetical protein
MYQFKLFSSIGGSTQLGAWDLTTVTSNDNSITLRVLPGLIGGTLPQNWEQTFSVQRNTKTYFIVKVRFTSSANISSVNIRTDSSPPNPIVPKKFALPTEIDVLFGVFDKGSIYRTVRNGDISLTSKIIVTTIEQTNGEIPYSNYYTIIINGGENEQYGSFGYAY